MNKCDWLEQLIFERQAFHFYSISSVMCDWFNRKSQFLLIRFWMTWIIRFNWKKLTGKQDETREETCFFFDESFLCRSTKSRKSKFFFHTFSSGCHSSRRHLRHTSSTRVSKTWVKDKREKYEGESKRARLKSILNFFRSYILLIFSFRDRGE